MLTLYLKRYMDIFSSVSLAWMLARIVTWNFALCDDSFIRVGSWGRRCRSKIFWQTLQLSICAIAVGFEEFGKLEKSKYTFRAFFLIQNELYQIYYHNTANFWICRNKVLFMNQFPCLLSAYIAYAPLPSH